MARGRVAIVRSLRAALLAAGTLAILAAARPATAQDMEPRAFSPVPVGLNFVALAYAYSYGNVLFDPAIPIEQAQDAREVLSGLGVPVDYREYPMGHEIRPEAIDDIVAWLAEKSLRPVRLV